MKLSRGQSNREGTGNKPTHRETEGPGKACRFNAWLADYRRQLDRICQTRLLNRDDERPDAGKIPGGWPAVAGIAVSVSQRGWTPKPNWLKIQLPFVPFSGVKLPETIRPETTTSPSNRPFRRSSRPSTRTESPTCRSPKDIR
jgi:hypothetical protein